jgi:hypothetical protein
VLVAHVAPVGEVDALGDDAAEGPRRHRIRVLAVAEVRQRMHDQAPPALAVAVVDAVVPDLLDRPTEQLGQVSDRRPVRSRPRSLPRPVDAGPAGYRVDLRAGVDQQADLRRHVWPVAAARIVPAERDPRPLLPCQVGVSTGRFTSSASDALRSIPTLAVEREPVGLSAPLLV